MPPTKALVWFRRDLRDSDHAALAAALNHAQQVWCIFVFDRQILDALPSRQDRRVEFILQSLQQLDDALRARGGGLLVRHGWPVDEIPALATVLGVHAVYANRDYEPAAKARDAEVARRLSGHGIAWHSPRDQAILDGDAVLTQAGQPYTVFTPYKNAWKKRLTTADTATLHGRGGQLMAGDGSLPTLADLGFARTDLAAQGIDAGMRGARRLWEAFSAQAIDRYAETRDFPALAGVSRLSVHLRFGTISVRALVREALARNAEAWLNELIWRDFYFMILDHFPHVVGRCFKPEFDAVQWDDWPQGLQAWQAGQTGYPLVDAAMRQLRDTGWMHNRLRMVVASFLTKDLGIDWRLGQAWFARHLLDFDLAANNGGWQWAASTGCDAQPYFRIFNPVTQSQKFDPTAAYIRSLVPELKNVAAQAVHAPWLLSPAEQVSASVTIGRDYPAPIVDHSAARQATLARFAAVKGFAALKK